MAGTSARTVAVGKPNLAVSGGVLVAPVGTARPDSYNGPYDSAYVSVGYVSDAGATESSERAAEVVRARAGPKVRPVQTELGTTLSLSPFVSRNADALLVVFCDDNVTASDGEITIKRNEKVLPHRQFIIDMLDGDNSRHLDVGYGQVTEVGDISYVDGETISYELTISCEPDDNGDSMIERMAVGDDGDDEGESGNV